MSKLMPCGAALLCALGAVGTSSASVIMHTALPDGQMSVNLNVDGVDVLVQSDPRAFQSKTVAGVTGTGVGGGTVSGEIDNSEYIIFTFATPQIITCLEIAHLYAAGNYGDTVNESAKIVADGVAYVLGVTGATTASWSGFGTVSNLSPGLENNGGQWSISGADLFGGPITTLKLLSNQTGPSPKADYSFRKVEFVPAPGAAALAGLGGACLLRRRRS